MAKGCDCEKWGKAKELGVFIAKPGGDREFYPWHKLWADEQPHLKFRYCPFCSKKLEESNG